MKIKKILSYISIVFLVILILFLSFCAIFTHITLKDVKNIDLSLERSPVLTTLINIDNTEKKLNNNIVDRIKIEDLNDYTIQAFISIEDKNFYNHHGVSPLRMLKAFYVNAVNGKIKQGASTITQQLVKNKYLNNEKSISRKVKEMYLAIKLEKVMTKNQILEEYLNTIYFGHGAYGIENASIRYFNKPAKELNINESALLASIINAPSIYSPINNMELATKRKNLVLNEMKKEKYISNDDYLKLIYEDIKITSGSMEINDISLYDRFVLDEASKILNMNVTNILSSGYKIYTYQESDTQEILDNTISNEKFYPVNEHGNKSDGLAIIIDNETHGVIGLSGKSKYDLLNIKRQPGSLIKPVVVYAPALEEGIASPITQILDEEINYNGYTPHNVGNKYYGYVSVQDAVAKSLNIPTIKLSEKLSLDKCKSYGEKCGIKFNDLDNGYALVLGGLTDGVTLKEITDAYSPYINVGNYTKSKFIKEIKNSNNVTIYRDNMSYNNVYGADTAWLMTETLKYSVDNGTSQKLSKFDFDIAGKTGTVAYKNTNKNTDAYSLAYTTKHTMSVWLGNYTMSEEFMLEGYNNGGAFCTEIICNVFDEIYKNITPQDFQISDSVIECQIDSKTLADEHIIALANNIPERYVLSAYFSKRYKPTNVSTKFNKINDFDFNINQENEYVKISFIAKDYLEYYIYRSCNGVEECIDKIFNHNNEYIFKDYDIENDKVYSYYIVSKNKYNRDITTKTNIKQIIIKKNYDNLYYNSYNTSWLFA